jgi:hypothetical protein
MQTARREPASRRIRQPPPDPIRKIRFREAAREIVAKDRHNRKYGYAVDTAGAIARAMERAYRQGFTDAHSKAPAPLETVAETTDSAIEWVLIPPRPRMGFLEHLPVCAWAGGATGERRPSPPGHDRTRHRRMATGGPGPARLGQAHWGENDHATGPVRLGLLEKADGKGERLLLSTARGKATWQRFVERRRTVSGGFDAGHLTGRESLWIFGWP